MQGAQEKIILPDGRSLAVSVYGKRPAKPVLYFHGCPGSRLDLEMCDTAFLRESGVQIIAVDRPGIGGSDNLPGRTLLDWPADVAALADSMGLQRFYLLAVSGGAPFAAACLQAMADRIAGTALACPLFALDRPDARQSMSRRHRFVLHFARRQSVLLHLVCRTVGWVIRHQPGLAVRFMAAAASAADREVLASPALQQALIRSFREAIRHSLEGVMADLRIYVRPWGFVPGACRGRVHLWQGLADKTVPPEMGRLWDRELPDCTASFLPEEGHFSLPVNHLADMVRALVQS